MLRVERAGRDDPLPEGAGARTAVAVKPPGFAQRGGRCFGFKGDKLEATNWQGVRFRAVVRP